MDRPVVVIDLDTRHECVSLTYTDVLFVVVCGDAVCFAVYLICHVMAQ